MYIIKTTCHYLTLQKYRMFHYAMGCYVSRNDHICCKHIKQANRGLKYQIDEHSFD